MTCSAHHPHLFLDFDGVLHPTSASREGLFAKATLLIAALEGSRCAVVISSSWRHHHPMGELLSRLPDQLRVRVVGATGEGSIGRWARHQEILAYVRRCGLKSSWRALDDSWNEFPPVCPEFIVCNPNTGLANREVEAVRQWLDTTDWL